MLSGAKLKQSEEPLNSIEASVFRSMNSPISWLRIAASRFCAYASISLQQKGPTPQIKDVSTQSNVLKDLKRRGTLLKYSKPLDKKEYKVSVVRFSDGSRNYQAACWV